MDEQYAANGVRVRVDGKGDVWAEEHRSLGTKNNMQDFDAFAGLVEFACNGTDTLFAEYSPDRWENRGNLIRQFALVALFDRKQTLGAIDYSIHGDCPITTAFQLHMCRVFSKLQPFPPRFFFVAPDGDGWVMQEIDINTGSKLKVFRYRKGDMSWIRTWVESGLTKLRDQLTDWLKKA